MNGDREKDMLKIVAALEWAVSFGSDINDSNNMHELDKKGLVCAKEALAKARKMLKEAAGE